jgi:endonuclease/exonuclease/phosphatase family metal-dependent hydrolase
MKIKFVFLACMCLMLVGSLRAQEKDVYRLMFLNIWYKSGQDSLARVLESTGADVIGLSEISNERLFDLAQRLGYPHVHPLMKSDRQNFRISYRGVLSRYPITPLDSFSVMIELPGQPVLVRTVHLVSTPYLPYDIRDGKYQSAPEVVSVVRQTKGPEIEEHLLALKPYQKRKVPVFLIGDFNEPSYLDWTEATKARHFNLVVDWPTHRRVKEAGFTDAYRLLYPDPSRYPGNTWSPLFPETPQDRIDFIYYAGKKIRIRQVRIVGEAAETSDDYSPYHPSDHRGLIVDFTLKNR